MKKCILLFLMFFFIVFYQQGFSKKIFNCKEEIRFFQEKSLSLISDFLEVSSPERLQLIVSYKLNAPFNYLEVVVCQIKSDPYNRRHFFIISKNDVMTHNPNFLFAEGQLGAISNDRYNIHIYEENSFLKIQQDYGGGSPEGNYIISMKILKNIFRIDSISINRREFKNDNFFVKEFKKEMGVFLTNETTLFKDFKEL